MDEQKNLHLFFSDLVVETRLFKEAEFTLERSILSDVFALGIRKDGLLKSEIHSSGLKIMRIRLFIEVIRKWKIGKFKIIRIMVILMSLLQYAAYSFRMCQKLKVDYVSIHNLPLLPLGCIIKLLFKVRLIYLPHELETERSGVRGFFKSIFKISERFCIRQVNHTVTVCAPISNWYLDSYQLDNIYTVRNVPAKKQLVRCNDVIDIRRDSDISAEDIVFIYQGLLSEGRGITLLIESFKRAKKKIVFMGHGDLTDEIVNEKSKYIRYLAPVEASKICSQTAKADVGVHINQDCSLSYKYSLPNKFFEYLHAGLPIIVSPNMEYLADLVVRYNLGWVVDPENLVAFLVDLKQSECIEKRESIAEYAAHAIYENDAKVFESIYVS